MCSLQVLLGEVTSGPTTTQVVVKELKASAGVHDQMHFLDEAQPYRYTFRDFNQMTLQNSQMQIWLLELKKIKENLDYIFWCKNLSWEVFIDGSDFSLLCFLVLCKNPVVRSTAPSSTRRCCSVWPSALRWRHICWWWSSAHWWASTHIPTQPLTHGPSLATPTPVSQLQLWDRIFEKRIQKIPVMVFKWFIQLMEQKI